jgi:hypothetical protein
MVTVLDKKMHHLVLGFCLGDLPAHSHCVKQQLEETLGFTGAIHDSLFMIQ